MASSADAPVDDDRRQRLERLYELRDEFRTVAETDGPYAKYAREALRVLEEEGYDV